MKLNIFIQYYFTTGCCTLVCLFVCLQTNKTNFYTRKLFQITVKNTNCFSILCTKDCIIVCRKKNMRLHDDITRITKAL